MNTAKTAVLSVFWQKNGLGPLGVKRICVVKTFEIFLTHFHTS